MAFKLGSNKGLQAEGGNIKSKFKFKTEKEVIPGTPVFRKKLGDGIMGEANMDGSIYINKNIVPGSYDERQVINHEMRHSTDMRIGKLAYGDDFVRFDGVTYPRKTINGKDMIIVDGVAKEAGSTDFPWEKDANNE